MGRKIDLTNQRFGCLLAMEDSGIRKNGSVYWKCRCDCGKEVNVRSSNLRDGTSKSCGCSYKGGNKTHGESKTRLYVIWSNMKHRATNENIEDYAGRGIGICEDWLSYENFRDWALKNGYEDSFTLDRIDVNGNYEPSNCRWVDKITQQNNKRDNNLLVFGGKSQTIPQWSRELGIKETTLYHRYLTAGWSVERTLTESVNK